MGEIDELVELREGNDGEVVEIEFAEDGKLIIWGDEDVASVKFFAFDIDDGSTFINGLAAATAANGVLSYKVSTGPVLLANRYTAYYQVIDGTGKKTAWPDTDNLILVVTK